MSPTATKLAVLFADISGSTALYESLGDVAARQLIAQCIAVMSAELPPQQGNLIKVIGDEIMCTFPTAELAFKSACAMQKSVRQTRFAAGHDMHIRIGFHYGEVILDEGDVFGDTVNVAARVVAITRADQIMTTQAVIDTLPRSLREQTRQIMRAEFKGKQTGFDISVVIWEMDEMMNTRIGNSAFRKTPETVHELLLSYREQSLKVNKERRSVMLGRGENCDLIVHNNFASRQHLRIELRFGKFILVDQSTNGTHLRRDNGQIFHALREELILQDSGSISMGQPYAENPVDLVQYTLLPQAAKGDTAP